MHDGIVIGVTGYLNRVSIALRRLPQAAVLEDYLVDYVQGERRTFRLEYLAVAHAVLTHEVALVDFLRDIAGDAAFEVHQSEARVRLLAIGAELREVRLEQREHQERLDAAAARDPGNPAVYVNLQSIEE